jgi:hypothetical protein
MKREPATGNSCGLLVFKHLSIIRACFVFSLRQNLCLGPLKFHMVVRLDPA